MKDIGSWVALVTGGASGIGRLTALGLAGRGARVAVWDLDEAALRSLENEAKALGLNVVGMTCDVSKREQV
jgi:all-trans-retinol dehydrogenase (NAD+)